MTSAHVPLHNADAEQAVLAAMLIDRVAIAKARAACAEEDFFASRHRALFRAILELSSDAVEVDPLTLAARLESRSELAMAGGKDYIGFLVDAVPTSLNVQYHAEIVQRLAAKRRLLATLAEARTAIETGEDRSLVEITGSIQSALSSVVTIGGRRGFSAVTGDEIVDLADELIARRTAREDGRVVGVATGYPEIDDVVHGFRPSEFVIIAARPKCGKTTFVVNVAVNEIVDRRSHVGFVSTEMKRSEILEGAGSRLARVNREQAAGGYLTDAEVQRFATELLPLKEHLHIDDEAFPTLEDVIARSIDLKARHPEIAFIVVDYLQRITKHMKGRRGDEEISAVTEGLKKLAKAINIPVIAPAQVNYKDTDKRESKKPTSADVQGSSGPAQDANFLFILHRPALFDPNPDLAYVLEVELAESRRTAPFIARLDWQGEYMGIDSHRRRNRHARTAAST